MPQVEVLSPAGSMESFRAAINAGADAIYVGGSMFGARAYANNFNTEQLNEAIDLAHIHDRKVYLTVNTLLKDSELEGQLYDFLCPAYEHGLDAVIVQDFGVFEFVKKEFPLLDIHASTQMTTNSVLSAKFLQDKGASRIVTSRELTLQEIKAIHKEISIEIESFVHGALCYCYSGQCLLSSMIGGRSGNRGRCAQPCRLQYTAYDGDNIQGKKDNHVLSPKDICTLEILPDIIDAGVYSLKIEGRMKSPEYTAGVVAAYRKYVDMYCAFGRNGYSVNPQDINDLMDLFNRGNFSKGYYVMGNGPEMMAMNRPNHQGTAAIEVVSAAKGKMNVKALETLNPQDIVDVSKDFTWTNGQRRKTGEIFSINIPATLKVRAGQVFYRVKNNKLVQEIIERYIDNNIREDVIIKGEFFIGKPVHLVITCGSFNYELYGNVVMEAQKSPVTVEQIKSQLSKLGNTEFEIERINIEADDNIFIPVQELKNLRRQLIAGLTEKMVVRRDSIRQGAECEEVKQAKADKIHINVTVYNKKMLDKVLEFTEVSRIYYDMTTTRFADLEQIVTDIHNAGKEAFLVLPYVFRKNTIEQFSKNLVYIDGAGFDGYLIKNLDELQFLKKHSLEGRRILDYNVYRFNRRGACFFENDSIESVTLPLELNHSEIGKLDNYNAEMVVFGYMPVMVSAQCVMKNLSGCKVGTDKANHVLYLKDRVGKKLQVVNCCDWCYNIICNSTQHNLLDYADEINALGVNSIRLDLRFMENDAIANVLSFASAAFLHNEKVTVEGDFTRGHFLRGVE